MSRQVVLDDGEVRHGGVGHGRVVRVPVLGYDEVAAPGAALVEAMALDFADALVHREGHAVTGDEGVEDDVRRGELLDHDVERFHELCPRRGCRWAIAAAYGARSGRARRISRVSGNQCAKGLTWKRHAWEPSWSAM